MWKTMAPKITKFQRDRTIDKRKQRKGRAAPCYGMSGSIDDNKLHIWEREFRAATHRTVDKRACENTRRPILKNKSMSGSTVE